MQWRILKYSLGVLGGLGILGNLVWADWKIWQISQTGLVSKTETIVKEVPVATSSAANICPAACDSVIDAAIKKIPPATQTTVTKTITAPASTVPKEYVIPLGSGTVTENDKWMDIYSAQTTINTDNYPRIKAAYFEAVMHIPNGQGEIKAKLVETTIPFYYGDIIKTNSGTGQQVSTPMILQTGNRNYRVQLNNQIGSGVLDSARIRIVTQ